MTVAAGRALDAGVVKVALVRLLAGGSLDPGFAALFPAGDGGEAAANAVAGAGRPQGGGGRVRDEWRPGSRDSAAPARHGRSGILLNFLSNGAIPSDNVGDDNGLRVTDGSVDPVSGMTRAIAFPYIGFPNSSPAGPNP